MMKWGSPDDVLKQLPPSLFGAWGGLGILPPLQPPTFTSPLVKAGRVPLTGITEGATTSRHKPFSTQQHCPVHGIISGAVTRLCRKESDLLSKGLEVAGK